jgi:putative ABC transport system permease protein
VLRVVRHLVGSELTHRRGRAAALVAGLFVATLGFIVLTGTSNTQRLEVRGTVSKSFRSAYDILVRPHGTRTALERQSGLVRPNYLSGLFGGIRMRQWRRIQRIPGIAVAAPIANVGYVLATFSVPVDLTRFDPGAGRALFRIRVEWSTDRGLTRLNDTPAYVYITNRPIKPLTGHGLMTVEGAYEGNTPHEVLPGGREVSVCPQEAVDIPLAGPFDPRYRTIVNCFSRVSGLAGERRGWGPFRPGHMGLVLRWPVPILLAAVDAPSEARLTGLDRAVVRGRYLRDTDAVRDVPRSPHGVRHLAVPVLAASRTLVDQAADLTVERFGSAAAAPVPGTRLPDTAVHPLERYLHHLRGGTRVGHLRIGPAVSFARLRDALQRPLRDAAGPVVAAYWTVGPTGYRRLHGVLVPTPTRAASAEVWQAVTKVSGDGPPNLVPTAVRDVQFRRLQVHAGHWNNGDGEITPWPLPSLFSVGEFDPDRLRSFDPRSALPLETYSPPDLAPGGGRARRLLRGRPLAPTANLGGYLTQPPLMLTTLRAAKAFGDQTFDGAHTSAPISAIRVRVAGVTGPDAASRERIRLAAERIVRATGLEVDVTTGSSPAPTSIALPAGRFGRPALRLTEPWVKKGVAASILSAVDRKSVVLFTLILLVCALFVANATAAAMRVRRSELGVLAAVGWSRAWLFRAVLAEVGVLGAVAGVLAAAVALPIGRIAGVHVSPGRALLAVPAAAILAMAAGWFPAARAARLSPIAAISPPVMHAGRGWRPRRLWQLALISTVRTPGRAALAAAAVAIGVCALTLLLAATFAFSKTLVGSILGDAISVQVRAGDYAAVGMTLVLAAATVADVLFLNIRDREGELATLRATGWDDRSLTWLVVLEGVWVAVLGSVVGCVAGLGGAAAFAGGITGSLVIVGVCAAAGGAALGAAAAAVPTMLLRRGSLTEALAAE